MAKSKVTPIVEPVAVVPTTVKQPEGKDVSRKIRGWNGAIMYGRSLKIMEDIASGAQGVSVETVRRPNGELVMAFLFQKEGEESVVVTSFYKGKGDQQKAFLACGRLRYNQDSGVQEAPHIDSDGVLRNVQLWPARDPETGLTKYGMSASHNWLHENDPFEPCCKHCFAGVQLLEGDVILPSRVDPDGTINYVWSNGGPVQPAIDRGYQYETDERNGTRTFPKESGKWVRVSSRSPLIHEDITGA